MQATATAEQTGMDWGNFLGWVFLWPLMLSILAIVFSLFIGLPVVWLDANFFHLGLDALLLAALTKCQDLVTNVGNLGWMSYLGIGLFLGFLFRTQK